MFNSSGIRVRLGAGAVAATVAAGTRKTRQEQCTMHAGRDIWGHTGGVAKTIFKMGILSAMALVLAAEAARAALPSPSEVRAVNEAIASGDPATIRAKCAELDDRKRSVDTGEKGAWEKLLKKCQSALKPPPGGVIPGTGVALGGSGGLPVTPGPTGGGTNPPPPPPPPPPAAGLKLPAPPPRPDFKLPKCFRSVQEKIDFVNAIGVLKNRWWGYSNKLKEMANKFGGANNPA